jgi:serine/threonine protein kinase
VDDEAPVTPQEALVVDALFLTREGQNHENLIKVLKHGWLPTAEYYYIDMEFCEFDMHTYIVGGDNYTVSEDGTPSRLQGKRGPYDIIRIAKQLASGIEFIHQHTKVHRDLKPKNSFTFQCSANWCLVLYSRTSNKWKIADLGLASEGTSFQSMETFRGGGTDGYYAPEFVLAEQRPFRYTNKVDIWALGCIIYELATGKKAFEGNETTLRFGLSKSSFPRQRFPFDGASADFLFKLIEKMLTIDKKARPGAAEILAELRGYSFNASMQSIPKAYSLEDKFWLTIVGNELHHVKTLCNRSSGGSQAYEVSPFALIL